MLNSEIEFQFKFFLTTKAMHKVLAILITWRYFMPEAKLIMKILFVQLTSQGARIGHEIVTPGHVN